MRGPFRFLLLPLILLGVGTAGMIVRQAEARATAADEPSSRTGDAPTALRTSGKRLGDAGSIPPDQMLPGTTPTIVRIPAADPASAAPTIAGAHGGKPAPPCDSCDQQAATGPDGQPVAPLAADRPTIPAELQPGTSQPPPGAALETQGDRGVVITDAIDMGFPYQPKEWRDGLLEIDNRSGRDVLVSLHGPAAANCQIDGQDVVEGREYVVRTATQIKGPSEVGVHVRTRGEGHPTNPDGNG